MNVQHLTAGDFVRQPWKNGGGSTLELLSHVREDRLLWRVSIADVERSGPFSDFTGYERTIMLLDGDGMELTIDDAPPVRIAQAFAPLGFDGGAKTECRLLGGPVRDFNLMVDRASVFGTLTVQRCNPDVAIPLAVRWSLIYCLQGDVDIVLGSTGWPLSAGELLCIDAAMTDATVIATAITSDALLATIAIQPI